MYKRLKDYEGNSEGLLTGLISDKPLEKQQQYKEEAKSIGLDFLGKAQEDHGKLNSSYSRYEWKICGHRVDYQMTHVRMNNVVCKECLEDKYKEQAKQVGYVIVGKADNNQLEFRSARKLACNHVRDIRYATFTSLTLNSVCPICYEEKLSAEAIEKGLTFLGAAKDHKGTYRRYRFNACGHERDIHAQCIPIGRFLCTGCQEEAWKESAKEQGLEYIGPPSIKSNQKKQFKLPCGCLKDIRLDHVRGGRWCCNVCSNYHYVRPSNVYLYLIKHEGFSWLKLGYAKDIKVRKNTYGLIKGCDLDLVCEIPISTGYKAMIFENQLHKKYKPFNIKSKLMEKYHTWSGHTECYSIDIKEELIKDILNYKE